MPKIKIMEMTLTDFEGQEKKKVTFENRTVVSGKNGCGKTTLADAFLWVFCDKDYSLKKNPDIRPDDGRKCLPRVDIDLMINETPVSIAKFQKKSESKSGKISLSNSYEINGDEMGWEKFKDSMKEMGINFEKFLILAHPDAFLKEKDKDAREILLSIPNKESESDLAIARITPGCSHIVSELERHSMKKIESIQKEIIKVADARIKSIPGEIRRCEANKSSYDINEIELQKKALQEQINEIELQFFQSDNGKISSLKDDLMRLSSEKAKLELNLSNEINSKRFQVQNNVNHLEIERNSLVSNLERKTSELENSEKDLQKVRETIKELQQQYIVKDHEYAEKIESVKKEVFSETDTVCPTCGQILPEEQIEELKANFEKNKQNKIELLSKMKKQEIESIASTGTTKTKSREVLKEQIEKLKPEIEKMTEELENVIKLLKKENEELKEVPKNPDFSNVPEYQKILKEISEKEAELHSMDNSVETKKQLSERLESKKSELAAVYQKIGEISNNVKIDENIAELKEEWKKYSQESANAQMILDELKTLSMAKNKILEDAVNQYFNGVRVKLFDTQKNGEVVDACIWYVQDKDGSWKKLIGNANTALVTKGKIAIIDGLQKFYGLSYPVFVDYAAELDNDSLAGIKADMQLIFLKVTEGDMKVTEV